VTSAEVGLGIPLDVGLDSGAEFTRLGIDDGRAFTMRGGRGMSVKLE
jgi:hypothetical protein